MVSRALIVEDEACLAAILREVLESAGHEVVTAADGDSALNIVTKTEGKFDLLLCDLGISGAAAPEVVGVVRMLHPDVRVVIITGQCKEDAAHYEIPGNFCVLEKPFSIRKPIECLNCIEEPHSCDKRK